MSQRPKDYQSLEILRAKAGKTSESIFGQTNNLPEDISIYIQSLVENSTLQTFLDLCKILIWFHENPTPNITIIYEAEFNYKLKCLKAFPHCSTVTKFGCQCQILSFHKASIDYEEFAHHQVKGRFITSLTLMDYFFNLKA